MARFRKRITVAAACIAGLVSVPVLGQDNWTATQNLSGTPEASFVPSVAVDGSTVHVAWMDDYTVGSANIHYKRSTDGGRSWHPSSNLFSLQSESSYPDIAADGGNVHLVWMDNLYGDWKILYKKSTDGGAIWPGTQTLGQGAGGALFPKVAVEGSNVHVVWSGSVPGTAGSEIVYIRSTDGGATWSSPRNLSAMVGGSSYPAISVDANVVHVVWMEYASGNSLIRYAQSADGGTSWASPVNVPGNAGWWAFAPVVAGEGTTVHIAWPNFVPGGNYEIFYNRSADGGLTWSQVQNLSNDAGSSQAAAIAAAQGTVHVAWYVRTPPLYEFPQPSVTYDVQVFYRRSDNGGLNWGAGVNLSENAGESTAPSLAVDGGGVHVVWTDTTPGNMEIFYRFGAECGSPEWSPSQNLSNNQGESRYPDIAVDGSNVHVVWSDSSYQNTGNENILYRRSTDGGLSWAASQIIGNSPTPSLWPAIAVAGNTLHVVWAGNVQYTMEMKLHYSRSSDGGLTWSSPQIIPSAAYPVLPDIAEANGTVHVAWLVSPAGSSAADTYHSASSDGGMTWSTPKNLSNSAKAGGLPSVAAVGDTVHVAWEESTDVPGNQDVYHRRSTDGGATWTPAQEFSVTDRTSYYPAVEAVAGAAHLVWSESPDLYGGPKILHKRSTDGGATWTAWQEIGDADRQDLNPAAAANGSEVHATWQETTLSEPGEIYHNRSTDGGATWGGWACQRNLSENAGDSESPAIVLEGSNAHVVWSDDTVGNDEILYRRTTAKPAGASGPLAKCLAFPWLCKTAEFERNIVKLKCYLEGCVIIDPLPENCLVKFNCPGCSPGGLCPPWYHLFLDGLDPVWKVGLFDAKGDPVPHGRFDTSKGLVISFRPDKDRYVPGRIGDYLLVFEQGRGGRLGIEYRVEMRLQKSDRLFDPGRTKRP